MDAPKFLIFTSAVTWDEMEKHCPSPSDSIQGQGQGQFYIDLAGISWGHILKPFQGFLEKLSSVIEKKNSQKCSQNESQDMQEEIPPVSGILGQGASTFGACRKEA